jgi:hypothetical protein
MEFLNVEEMKNIERGAVVLIKQFDSEFIARVCGWDHRTGGLDYNALTGGGSIAREGHVIKVIDTKLFYESEIYAKAYAEYWGVPFKPQRPLKK